MKFTLSCRRESSERGCFPTDSLLPPGFSRRVIMPTDIACRAFSFIKSFRSVIIETKRVTRSLLWILNNAQKASIDWGYRAETGDSSMPSIVPLKSCGSLNRASFASPRGDGLYLIGICLNNSPFPSTRLPKFALQACHVSINISQYLTCADYRKTTKFPRPGYDWRCRTRMSRRTCHVGCKK